jgi:nitrate/nitrite-specific signal transduction histidine kinase
MKAPLQKNTIRAFALYWIIGIIIALYSVVIYHYVRMQVYDNTRINSAGRLRMLTQKITKDIFLFEDGRAPKNVIEDSLALFDSNIHAITDGGTVALDLERTVFIALPAMDDRGSHDILVRVIRDWQPFRDHVRNFLGKRDMDSLKYIMEHNEKLMSSVDRSVMAIQNHAGKDDRVMGLIISSAIAIVIIAVLLALVRQVRRYRLASARLEEIEHLLPICSSCKKIRTDNKKPMDPRSWVSIEQYLHTNKDMLFTHSLCPDCAEKLYPGILTEKPPVKDQA